MSGKSNRMNAGIPSTPLNALPGFQHEAAGAVFAVTGDLVLLQHAEGFAGKVGAIDAGWIEDVAEVALVPQLSSFKLSRLAEMLSYTVGRLFWGCSTF